MPCKCLTYKDTAQYFEYTSIPSGHRWLIQWGGSDRFIVHQLCYKSHLVSTILICINLPRCNTHRCRCNKLQASYTMYSRDLAFRNHYHLTNCSCPLLRSSCRCISSTPFCFQNNSHLCILDLKCKPYRYIYHRCYCSRDTGIANFKCRKNQLVRHNSTLVSMKYFCLVLI